MPEFRYRDGPVPDLDPAAPQLRCRGPPGGSIEEHGMDRALLLRRDWMKWRGMSNNAATLSKRSTGIAEALEEMTISYAERLAESVIEGSEVCGAKGFWSGWDWLSSVVRVLANMGKVNAPLRIGSTTRRAWRRLALLLGPTSRLESASDLEARGGIPHLFGDSSCLRAQAISIKDARLPQGWSFSWHIGYNSRSHTGLPVCSRYRPASTKAWLRIIV